VTHDYVIADVFTDTPLEGNPVAVFLDAGGLDGPLMQRTARELNLSETVFITGRAVDGGVSIRIFTPSLELPFAGHPVLGTAFILGEGSGDPLVMLHPPAGAVPVALTRDAEGRVVHGEMEQPRPIAEDPPETADLLAALGLQPDELVLPIAAYRNGPLHVYVALGSDERVATLRPDLGRLESIGSFGASCFHADRASGRVHTRMFGPGVGVAEDPATGSAAGPLAVYLAGHGVIAYGQRIEIHQGIEIGRPSRLLAQVDGGPERLERVLVGGSAVIVARGQFHLR
jgi:trans-2,3-dihydro-3-hydroxyanthranilate isomerase